MKRYLSEFTGTLFFVLAGTASSLIAGSQIGILGAGLSFGLAYIAISYAIGNISECHLNPAVSIAHYFAGRMKTRDLAGYILAQFIGAVSGAGILLLILSGKSGGFDASLTGLGYNSWGSGFLGEYGLKSAIVFEAAATLLLVIIFLGSTHEKADTKFSGIAIGAAIAVLTFAGYAITGTSLNPAKSFGTALYSGINALSHVWLFLVIPTLAGVIGGLLFRFKVFYNKK